jgi:hypothetical protein
MQSFTNLSYGKRIAILGLLIAAVLLYQIFGLASRSGENRVTIEVIPGDAKVEINDTEASAGDNYLSPGKYVIKASSPGFKSDEQTIEVKKSDPPVEVGLIPEPVSAEARKYIEENPDIQRNRERIGGTNARRQGEETENRNPIIAQLPRIDIIGPYTIDYGPSATREYGIFLEISNSSPDGRKNALKWIREQGQDPTDLEIIYSDFINPLAQGGTNQ